MKPTEQEIQQEATIAHNKNNRKLSVDFKVGFTEGAQWALSQMEPEWVAVRTAIEDRIKQLREADAKFCYDRWENKEISQMERNLARESSNSVTLARQELESILELFNQPPTDKP